MNRLFGVCLLCGSLFLLCFSLSSYYKKKEKLTDDLLLVLQALRDGIWMEQTPSQVLYILHQENEAADLLLQYADGLEGLEKLAREIRLPQSVTTALRALGEEQPTVKETAAQRYAYAADQLRQIQPAWQAKMREREQLCLRVGSLLVILLGILLL